MMDQAEEFSDLDQLRSRYAVLRQLGRDGACVVYAVRSRASDRHYAVKVISDPGFRSASPNALHVWHAHTVRELEHPRLLDLHAVHHFQGGAVAIAMERRPGRMLAELLGESHEPLPTAQIERVLREIAEALAYLHGRDVVHRGVSPHSIFLDRETGEARLAHFGIDRHGDQTSHAADSDAVLRAFAYLAPEQFDARGEVDDRRVSARSDLYSLGLVGYAMLTGRRLWEADSVAAMIGKKRKEPLPALSALRPDAPSNLRAAIERCLEQRPRRRWGTAEEMVANLDIAPEPQVRTAAADHAERRTPAPDGDAVLTRPARVLSSRTTRRWIALAVSVAIGGLVAASVPGGSDEPERRVVVDRQSPVAAVHETAPIEIGPLEISDSIVLAQPNEPALPRLPNSDDRIAEQSTPNSGLRRGESLPASPPQQPTSRPPSVGQQFSEGSRVPVGLVLLGDPIPRQVGDRTVLGDPVGDSRRGQ